MIKQYSLAVLLLASAALFNGCGRDNVANAPQPTSRYCLDDDFKQRITLAQPVLQPVTEGITLTGAVEANPDKVVPFMSLVSGVIANTYFSLGDRVVKGQVLAEMRSAELSSLQAQLHTLEAQLKMAASRLQSVQSMYDDGISAHKDLIAAQSELDVLRAERQKIQAHLALYSAGKGVFQIKAPATGIVTAKSIAAGSQVSAGSEPLFTISDLGEVWVMINVYATNVQSIAPGMEVNIKTLSYPDEVFRGKVAAISQVLDNEAKVLKARVVLPNSQLKLKPGMLVDVMAIRQQATEAVSIPTRALVFDEDLNYVVVYKDDCQIEVRRVEILAENNGTTFIAGGLDVADKIIAENQLLIYEQLKNFQN